MAPGLTTRFPEVAPAVSKPVPLQLVAAVLLHCSVLEPPAAIAVGVALSIAVGAAVTVTFALALLLGAPPAPLQTTE